MTNEYRQLPPQAGHASLAIVERLSRLETYLKVDPSNNTLLIEAFEVALQCGQWNKALLFLRQGQTSQGDQLSWSLKEGDFWLAQQQYDSARRVLDKLSSQIQPPPGFSAVVLHNLGYIDFRQGQFSACIERLSMYAEDLIVLSKAPGNTQTGNTEISPEDAAIQQLWLRALHHDSALTRAYDWVERAEKNSRLDPGAAGIASLIAIDAAQFAVASRWAEYCLVNYKNNAISGAPPIEVYVAQASLSLADQNAASAIRWADQGLHISIKEGRAWSRDAATHRHMARARLGATVEKRLYVCLDQF
jgi:tetratricopeptide (TPR) repeat protein